MVYTTRFCTLHIPLGTYQTVLLISFPYSGRILSDDESLLRNCMAVYHTTMNSTHRNVRTEIDSTALTMDHESRIVYSQK